MTPQRSAKVPVVPSAMRGLFYQLTELTDACAKEYLNDEYAALCRELIAALCRKRLSPLVGGSLNVWAAAVVHVVG